MRPDDQRQRPRAGGPVEPHGDLLAAPAGDAQVVDALDLLALEAQLTERLDCGPEVGEGHLARSRPALRPRFLEEALGLRVKWHGTKVPVRGSPQVGLAGSNPGGFWALPDRGGGGRPRPYAVEVPVARRARYSPLTATEDQQPGEQLVVERVDIQQAEAVVDQAKKDTPTRVLQIAPSPPAGWCRRRRSRRSPRARTGCRRCRLRLAALWNDDDSGDRRGSPLRT